MKENTIYINDSVIIYKGLGFNDLSDKLSDKRNELLYVNQGTLRITQFRQSIRLNYSNSLYAATKADRINTKKDSHNRIFLFVNIFYYSL